MDLSRGLIGLKLIVCWCVVSSIAQLHDTHRGPWTLVLKATPGTQITGQSSIANWFLGTGGYNENNIAAKTDFRSTSLPYRSTILDKWGTTKTISAVRMSMFKNNKEVAWIVFDAFGKTKSTFMDCGKILDAKWGDVKSQTKNYCTIKPCSDTCGRFFFVNRNYGGCSNDAGWMMVKDYSATSGCSEWDSHTSPRTPYFIYSGSSGYINWSQSRLYADSFAIFVLEWQMVFKGVDGVVPAAGSLNALWKGSTTENDRDESVRTLTKAPSKTYKSSMIENWNDLLIEMVKYSFFSQGQEKAYVIFSGLNTNKNSWFSNSNIKFSKYSDIKLSKVACGIDGDVTRRFALHKQHNGCPNDQAWMEILDEPSGPTPCSWDKNVRTRPYFLYSAGTTYTHCESGGSWYSSNFPAAETMGIFVKGWVPVLKLAQHMSVAPATGIYNMWTGTYTINEYDPNAMLYTAGSKTYKSSIVDKWSQYYISAVRLSMYKNGQEHKYMVFDAHGADKNSWFDCQRILYSSWNDISRTTSTLYCSIPGHASINRRFFLQRNYGGCSVDQGWFVIIEGTACPWEHRTTRPYILYSKLAGSERQDLMEFGEVFAISVSMDLCTPNPCQNGGVCYALSAKYQCVCSGGWTGVACTDKDGNWGSWSNWGSCTKTCASGTRTRSRQCNNPAPVGLGAACAGAGQESQACNTSPCPIDGQWSTWTSYSTCSVTCGGGSQSRTRQCNNPAPAHNGANCVGDGSQTQSCNTHHCPVDGQWSTWTSYSTCSVTCGGGSQSRTRQCNNPAPAYNGANCVGDGSQTQSCNTHHCPVDGQWSTWTSYGACPVTCGGGTQSRTRQCNNPAPAYNGANCVGDGSQSQSCNTNPCPVDGGFTAWTSWATCSVTCGGGTQGRTRTCTNPAPAHGGADCTGARSETQDCNTQVCIIDGGWGNWGSWGTCTKTCGGGTYSRARVCDSPTPANGGLPCSGDSSMFADCNTAACPTPAAGAYIQACPSGWFTCQSGTMTCVMQDNVCDCQSDCSDHSDEDEGYASCPSGHTEKCLAKMSAGSLSMPMMTIMVSLIFVLLLRVYRS